MCSHKHIIYILPLIQRIEHQIMCLYNKTVLTIKCEFYLLGPLRYEARYSYFRCGFFSISVHIFCKPNVHVLAFLKLLHVI